MAPPTIAPAVRFWPKVEPEPNSGCWLWTAALRHGYGEFHVQPRAKIGAHVWAYADACGPVPSGLELDHLCRVPRCVRPSHLEPVTRQTNQLRGNTFAARHAAAVRCPAGHLYTVENTYTSIRRQRSCRACKNIRRRNPQLVDPTRGVR
jgi:hypothetical protein